MAKYNNLWLEFFFFFNRFKKTNPVFLKKSSLLHLQVPYWTNGFLLLLRWTLQPCGSLQQRCVQHYLSACDGKKIWLWRQQLPGYDEVHLWGGSAWGEHLGSCKFKTLLAPNLDDAKMFIQKSKSTFWTKTSSLLWQLYEAFPSLLKHLPGPHNKIFRNYTIVQGFLDQEIKIHKQDLDPNNPRDYIDSFIIEMEKVCWLLFYTEHYNATITSTL